MKPTNTQNNGLLKRVAIVFSAVITALALALAFAFGFDSAKQVGVDSADSAESGEIRTSATTFSNPVAGTDKTASGALVNGDVIKYTSTGSVYNIKLPAGTYTLEAWGGQGGYGYANKALGGKGGYTKATYVTTSTVTLYVAVGGAGGNRSTATGQRNTVAGGYNGGGNAIADHSGCYHGGGGGGGATHIATSGGLLSSLSSSTSSILIVAGGGGGAGNIATVGGAGGGNASGTTGVVAGGAASNAKGGGTSSGGSCSGSYPGVTGGFGKGGNSGSKSGYCGGAGGGAGYYGGAGGNAAGTCSGYPAGGGSSYVKSGLTGSVFQSAVQSGAGQAIINVVSVNQNPTSKNASITLQARGSTATTAIAASTIANDPDATKTTLGFTANNASAASKLDTLPAANAGLWVKGINNTLATNYFTWTWATSTLTITSVKRYPRSGIDGSTADGKITLYTYVRDTFGTNAQRGVAAISFTVTVPINSMTQNPNTVVVTSKQGNNKLHFGISKNVPVPSGSAIDTTNIYNPLGANRYTAIYDQPIKYGEQVTVNAFDLVKPDTNVVDKSVNQNDSTKQDRIVAVVNSTASITGTGRKYALTEYDSNAGVTVYNASKVKLANAFSTLTFKCLTPDPAYQVFTVTVYQVEKTTMLASPYNTNVVPGVAAITVDFVFKMDNSRPKLRTNVAGGPVVTIDTLSTVPISLDKYFTDVDSANGTITASTHKILSVVVPHYEYVQVNKYGEIVSTYFDSAKNSYFNVLDASKSISSILKNGQLEDAKYATDFSDKYIYGPNHTASPIDIAYIQYSYSGATLTLTGLRATHDMYKKSRISNTAITGGTTDNPTVSGGVVNPGHFYILIKVQDLNDTSDNDIWLPLGIQVANKAPHSIETEHGSLGSGTMPTAEGASGQSFYFSPMGATINQQTYPIGFYKDEKTQAPTTANLRALAADDDNYLSSNMLNGLSIVESDQAETGKLNELVTITSTIDNLRNAINENSKQYYFSVSLFDIYIPVKYFGDSEKPTRLDAANYAQKETVTDYYGGTECVVIKGLKITLNNWTHNRYLLLNVNVADSAGATGTVQVAVNVENTAPIYGENVAQIKYTVDGLTVESTYTPATTTDGIATITYRVPQNTSFIVTPYDLVTDGNINTMLSDIGDDASTVLNNGFTLGGLSGKFKGTGGGVFTVGSSELSQDELQDTANNIRSVPALAKAVNGKNAGFDYTSGSYTDGLFAMIKALQGKRSFGVKAGDLASVATNNKFSKSATGTTWVENLYFARTTDESNLDAFSYNVYDEGASSSNRNAFVAPSIINSGYVDVQRGTIIKNDTNEYNLDFLVITAAKRTVSGALAVIELNVHDRTGAAGSGNAYGVKTIRIQVDVINSSPKVQYPEKCYTLRTNPIPTTEDVDDINSYPSKIVYPSTLVLHVADYVQKDEMHKNLLIDREDSEVWIDTASGYQVVSKYIDKEGKEKEREVDIANKAYSEYYINVTLTSKTITITALNSTQAIDALYIKFYATDGRYGSNGLLETSVCYIHVEVINSSFTYNTTANGVEEVSHQDYVQHIWNVESLSEQDIQRARYFVSGNQAAQYTREQEGAASAQIKQVVTDTDILQGVVLSAGGSTTSNGKINYVNANLSNLGESGTGEYKAALLAAYQAAVPQLMLNDVIWSEGPYAVRLFMSDLSGNKSSVKLEDKVDTDHSYIIYYVDGQKYTAADLKSCDDLEVLEKCFDEYGRWIVTDWAIKIKPTKSSTAGAYTRVAISMRDEAKFGGDTAGKQTAYQNGAANQDVVCSQLLNYDMFINGMGIQPATYFDQTDGFYGVTDPVTGEIYIPTYDGNTGSPYEEGIQSIYLVDNKITTSGSGTPLKSRVAGGNDNTKAGVHSGMVYNAQNVHDTNDFTWVNKDYTEKAFKYSDTIKVSADGSWTYIPMSYFGLPKSLAKVESDGSIVFNKGEYISYDTGKSSAYIRKSGYLDAVTIYDGKDTWNAGQVNPYVTIDGYDLVGTYYNKEDADNFKESPYFNNTLSLLTFSSDDDTSSQYSLLADDVSSDRTAAEFVASLQGKNNAQNIVGDKGQLLYLEGQDDITNGLQEHLFGLKLKKSSTRSQSASLTITVKIVLCSDTGSGPQAISSDSGKNSAVLTYKLEIGNSPITLVNTNSAVKYDDASGYYMELFKEDESKNVDFSTESPTQEIVLSRDGALNATRTVVYEDADIAYKTNADGDFVDIDGKAIWAGRTLKEILDNPDYAKKLIRLDSKSDIAKFSFESMRKMQFLPNYTRVSAVNGGLYSNVSTLEQANGPTKKVFAQKSIDNYFDVASEKDNGFAVNSSYAPNKGIFANNYGEGFNKYFSVSISADGTKLSITPKAKTIINSAMIGETENKKDYYAKRGLVYVMSPNNDEYAYYPLKVLIYDDHGNGFAEASYVALEIRVAIKGSAPQLSENLEKAFPDNPNDKSKKIDISLSINQPYSLNLGDAITGGNLLTNSNNDIFWAANYYLLKEKIGSYRENMSSSELEDLFRLETGTFLKSPFNYGTEGATSARVVQYSKDPTMLTNNNNRLISSKGFTDYSSNPNYSGIENAYLCDVIMYMDYTPEGMLAFDSTPTSSYVNFRVNRRTVSEQKTIDKFIFLLKFMDNEDNPTENLYVNINVVNQAPTTRSLATESAKDFKMRVNDSFTVVTTPYNRFVGSSDSTATVSASAAASETYSKVNPILNPSPGAPPLSGVGDVNLITSNTNVDRYTDLVETQVDKGGKHALRQYDSSKTNEHLGYLALADDDMPWGLRIESVSSLSYTGSTISYFEYAYKDSIDLENHKNTGKNYYLDVIITAKAVCNNAPITITLVDSDEARVTFTMYVTVESSKPVAIGEGDRNHTRNEALSLVYKNDGSGDLLSGVYSITMYANDKKANTVDTLNKAYSFVRLPINQIAYDPDENDVPAIYALNSDDYHAFTLNNSSMNKDKDNPYRYYNDYYEIVVNSTYTEFTIECKTYNPYEEFDCLNFFVRDSGNNIVDNRLPIEIRITTRPLSLTNDSQMTNVAIDSSSNLFRSVPTVNVKSYDKYSGNAADLPEDKEEREKIVNVNSVYPFLEYQNRKTQAIDQPEGFIPALYDPDVMLNTSNINYGLEIYAFLTNVPGNESEFEEVSLNNISSMFNLSGTALRNKTLTLKSQNELKDNSFLKSKGASINDFLIGGYYSGGISITNINRSLMLFLERYFMFDIGEDGVSLTFKPVSANLDVDIPIYVQITKFEGSRDLSDISVNMTCGSLFYLNIADSTPIANTDESVTSLSGKVGDSVIFKMFDKNDPYGSLFRDTDLNDIVTYTGIISDEIPTANYDKALPDVDESGIDWKAKDTINKPRAVDIEYNNTDKEVNGIPAYSVKVTINRRLDFKDKDGNYMPNVPLPIKLFCKDRGGVSVTANVTVTIQNSDIDIDRTKLTTEEVTDTANGYYTLTADSTNSKLYYIDAYVMPGKTLAPFYFVDGKTSYINDPDFTYMRTDTDSMRLVGKESATSETYLMYGKNLDVYSAMQKEAVATVKPIFGNDIVPDDQYHFVGFSVETHTNNRQIMDATATMRIIDKSGNPNNTANGFTVTLRIHILNAAPTVKTTNIKPIIFTGSTTKDGDPISIKITDYVTDRNGDPLRVVGVSAVDSDDPTQNNVHCLLDVDNSDELVRMTIDEKDQTKCTFASKMGYFGNQYVSVMVADILDSETGEQYDYAITEVLLHFVVGYDISSVTLNTLYAVRSLPTVVDVATLFESLKDSHNASAYSAEEIGMFNPGDDYEITSLTTTASGVHIYKDGDNWVFVSDKVAESVKFTATFKNRIAVDDPDVKEITLSFNAVVEKNNPPTLLENIKRQKEEGVLFRTGTGEFGLNNNGTVILSPTSLFADIDIDKGDVLRFDAKSVSVTSSTIATVRVSEDGTQLYITFNCRGETNLTVGVMDATGEVTKYTFKIKNIDRPEPSFWDNIVISYEVYPYIWWAVGAGLLLLILLLILIILLVKRRKRKQEELEAILLSEMELEEQMMRLNAGAIGANAALQSFGYLPPTMPTQNDPGMMLGAGGAVPNSNIIGLNPGDSGVPTDSDM